MKKVLISMALSVTGLALAAPGSTIAMNATIIDVASSIDNGASFAVLLSGGTGKCTVGVNGVGPWVAFPEAKAQSPTAYRHSYALALLALSSGKKVRIHNYTDDNCYGANFISVSNGASSTDSVTPQADAVAQPAK